MVKKQNEGFEPVVSQIPVPQSDSPLIIDLPDGQKLVVGNLANGTVIEVATWRGTGRPDSRTQRLMLGVSGVPEVESSQEFPHEKDTSENLDPIENFHRVTDFSDQSNEVSEESINSQSSNFTKQKKKKRKIGSFTFFLSSLFFLLLKIVLPFLNAFLPRSKHLKAVNPSHKRLTK